MSAKKQTTTNEGERGETNRGRVGGMEGRERVGEVDKIRGREAQENQCRKKYARERVRERKKNWGCAQRQTNRNTHKPTDRYTEIYKQTRKEIDKQDAGRKKQTV